MTEFSNKHWQVFFLMPWVGRKTRWQQTIRKAFTSIKGLVKLANTLSFFNKARLILGHRIWVSCCSPFGSTNLQWESRISYCYCLKDSRHMLIFSPVNSKANSALINIFQLKTGQKKRMVLHLNCLQMSAKVFYFWECLERTGLASPPTPNTRSMITFNIILQQRL